MDMHERPELYFGSYEYIATADYCKVGICVSILIYLKHLVNGITDQAEVFLKLVHRMKDLAIISVWELFDLLS